MFGAYGVGPGKTAAQVPPVAARMEHGQLRRRGRRRPFHSKPAPHVSANASPQPAAITRDQLTHEPDVGLTRSPTCCTSMCVSPTPVEPGRLRRHSTSARHRHQLSRVGGLRLQCPASVIVPTVLALRLSTDEGWDQGEVKTRSEPSRMWRTSAWHHATDGQLLARTAGRCRK